MELPSSSSSSSSSTPQSSYNFEHDVFLSFRGEDTRNSFTDHLYYAMRQKDINTFRDTEKLLRGKSISPELLTAIQDSKFAVAVLSTNYATSTWCLDELAHILECKKVRGLEVLPVFYHVEPCEIRKQTGCYGEAFAKHESDFKDNMRKVDSWREALKEIASLSGWHVTIHRKESEVIQEIINEVLKVLNAMLPVPERELVGMDTRIMQIEYLLHLESSDVLTLGIWGMGGVGKTTLAKEVFKKICKQFHPSGFVSHVRLQSEVELQRRLCESFLGDGNINIDTVEKGIKLLRKALSKKKVLIVLDDVDNFKQIECLAPGGPLGENIWGGGSRLIITTRDTSSLKDFPIQEIYEVPNLRDEEALQLLCQKAFKQDNPPEEFVVLSKSFLRYASGLPLALEVLGSYLSTLNVGEWSEILHRLDDDQDKDISRVLRISFDGLQDTDKRIFLDVACFFNGENVVRVKNILKGCGFSSKIGISNLFEKSLIKIERSKLWMHELLRDLGWHIVRGESSLPGKRSRLWFDENVDKNEGKRSWRFEDARNVLMDNTGTTAVEGLFLSFHDKEEMSLEDDPFLTMPKLRLLKICNVSFLDVHFRYISRHLRLLEWHECALESLPSNFKSDKLVEFKMPNSRIKQLWNDKLSLGMLVLMDLSNCQYLATTPDFSTVPNLERLILEGCTELSVFHPSIGDLQKLFFLNLKGCTNLRSLPSSISLRSLRIFILSGCSKLKQFPEILENMDSLCELLLDGTAIQELPVSIRLLKGLILLNLSGCSNLLSLPNSFCSGLTSLKFLYLSRCSSMGNLPENIGCLKHLEELDACGTGIRKVPESISGLKNLKLSCFHGCYGVTGLELPKKFSGLTSLTTLNLGGCNLAQGAIPDDVGDLFSLQSLDLSENNFVTIPESISKLSQLTEITFFKCSKLQSLPKDPPSSLRNVNLRDCPMLTSSSRWRRYPPQKGLRILNCRKKPEDKIFPEFHKFPLRNLKKLDLSNCQHLKKIPDMRGLPNLEEMILEGCAKLSEVHSSIGCLQQLVVLNLKGCVDLESLPHSISLKSLQVFVLSGCSKLKKFPEIEGLMDKLPELHLDGTALKGLPRTMHGLTVLTSMNLSGCRNLLTFPLLLSLKSLNLSGCSLISTLPVSLGNMDLLEELDVSETAITGLPYSIFLSDKLQVLSFSGCSGLRLPDWFSNLRSLRSLSLRRYGLAKEVLVLLYCLPSLKILDLGENSFLTIPNDIGRFSSLHRLDLSRNKIVDVPHEIGHLSSLQHLDLSGNNIVSISHEIGCLSRLQRLFLSENKFVSIPSEILDLTSLQVLDLSENNFVSVPERISRLSELTELHLFRCSKLQSLPNELPFSLKHVYAQECPLLKYNADTLTIRTSEKGFCLIHCGKFELDDDQPSRVTVPVPQDRIELLFPKFVADRVYGRMPFEIRFPYGTRIPNFWSHWRRGPSVTVPLSDSNRACMGLTLFVVFEILENNKFNKIWELEETICEFHTGVGPDSSLVFQNFIDFTAGSYALCYYEPQGGKFSGIFDKPSSQLRASVSTKRPDLKVRGCGIHLISEKDAAEFVNCLANQTANKHSGSDFDPHCECILNKETTTGDLMELESTSTSNDDRGGESNSTIKLRAELSKLYQGCNGREKSFHLCVAAPLVSIPPWFFYHDAGDITLCHITENLLDDQTWVGLELYVVFTRSRPAPALRYDDTSFSFKVEFCAYDHESTVMHRSIKINSCLGRSDQLVVLHVPRIHFQQQLNQCQGIGALFTTSDLEMEVQVCGSRLAFEHGLEDLTKSLTEVAGMSWEHVGTQIRSQAKQCMSWEHVGTQIRSLAKRIDWPWPWSWFQRPTASVPKERDPAPSLIVRLQNHRCYIQQEQSVHIRASMLLHSECLLFENRDRNQEIIADEDKTLLLPRHHVRIMAETLLHGRYSSEQWKTCLKLVLRQSKVATLCLGGQTISAVTNFDSSSTYSTICFSDRRIGVWFKLTPFTSTVGIKLPPKLQEDGDWRGLAICVTFEVKDQDATTSLVKFLCHLRAKDGYCLNPVPICSITRRNLKSLHPSPLTWLIYVPRVHLTELNVVTDVEARIYVNCPGLKVHECGMRLLYRHEEGKFNQVVNECWTSFFDNLYLIRRLVGADNNADQRGDTSHEPPILTRSHFKDFERDLIYNATHPSKKIPEWFRYYHNDPRELKIPLPAPSLGGNKDWIGLALCARANFFTQGIDNFECWFRTEDNGLSSLHQYRMTTAEFESLTQRHPPGAFIWVTYIPRRWFLHQLNGESFLSATLYDEEASWLARRAAHRFVYEDDVEDFKRLCLNLH